uniref:Structure-specific endonuclease subunit SLX4 n=1 Tax=Rhipicephalus zambeziensis TaxID=60191 RepID=A0A224Z068_9ACAR
MDRCAVWPRPEARCPACGECVAGAMEAHVEKCLQRFSKNPKSTESCVCVVCRKDITSLDEAQRMAHVNRCLDGEAKEPVQEPVVSTPSRNGSPGFVLLDCPLCERSFKTSEACKNHIKQCSTKLGMSPKQVVEAIRLQQRYVQERMAAGLPVVRRRRNAPADTSAAQRPAKKPRPVASVPKSKYQEEVQMARALSASLTTAGRDQDEAQRRFCEMFGSGHSSGRRRKHAVKETPMLLLTSADERAKKVEEKIELLLTQRMIGLELGDLSWCTKLKATGKLSNRIRELSTKDAPLWSLAGECRERQEDYYLCSLSPVVTPSTVEVGSRLKSLSQVPGRRLSGDLGIVDGLATGKTKPLESDRELSTQLHRDGLLSALNTTLSSTAACPNATQLKMPDSNEIGQGFLTQATEEEPAKEGSSLTPGAKKILQDLDALVGHRRFCDIRIVTEDGVVIPAHRAILFTRCPAAEKEVVSRPGEKGLLLYWTTRSKACILAFLHYIYSGALDLDKDDRRLHLDLRGMAFRYGMEELCEELKDRYFRNESEQDDDADGVADTSLDEILSSFWIEDDGGNGHREEDPVSDHGDNVESLEEVCEFLSSQRPPKNEGTEYSKNATEHASETVPVLLPPRTSLEQTTQPTSRSLLEQSSTEVTQQVRRRPGTPFSAPAPASPVQSEDEQAWMDLGENGHHRDEGHHDDSRGEETDHLAQGAASAHDDSDSCSEELFGESNDSASSVGNATEGDEDVEDRERVPLRQEAKRKRDSDDDEETAAQDGSQGSGEKCKDTDDVWDCVWDGFDDGAHQDAAPPERRPPSASRWDRQSPAAAKAASAEEVPREMLDSFFFEEQGDNGAAPTGLEHTPVSLPRYLGAPSHAYTPVTPLPDYGAMQTPELRDQLQQYGVRRLPRKQAVNVLNHIYDETHPLVPETPVRITFPRRGMNAGSDRDYRSGPMLTSGRPEPFSGSSSANEEPSHYSVSSRSSGEDGSCSDTSDTDIKEQLRRFFERNTELSESILMYEPIDFQKLRLNLKQANIRISSKSLINYLDEQCITFTMPRSEKQQAKQRRRQENFRRRLLGKRALGTAQEGLPS